MEPLGAVAQRESLSCRLRAAPRVKANTADRKRDLGRANQTSCRHLICFKCNNFAVLAMDSSYVRRRESCGQGHDDVECRRCELGWTRCASRKQRRPSRRLVCVPCSPQVAGTTVAFLRRSSFGKRMLFACESDAPRLRRCRRTSTRGSRRACTRPMPRCAHQRVWMRHSTSSSARSTTTPSSSSRSRAILVLRPRLSGRTGRATLPKRGRFSARTGGSLPCSLLRSSQQRESKWQGCGLGLNAAKRSDGRSGKLESTIRQRQSARSIPSISSPSSLV